MNVLINNKLCTLPSSLMTVSELLKWKNLNNPGTAVAVNDKLVKRDNWHLTHLADLDRITIISAAFGG